MNQDSDDIKRSTARRKATAVMDIIKGKTSAADLARTHGLTIAEVEPWMDDFVSTGTKAMLARFSTLRNAPANMLLRHDNDLVFGSRQQHARINRYNHHSPHQALKYLSPSQYYQNQCNQAA